MFDGLKDSLDRFRRDVEDAAEVEDEEELDADELDGDEIDDTELDADAVGEGAAGAEIEDGDPSDAENDTEFDEPEPSEPSDDESGEKRDAEEPEDDESGENDPSTGFARKAKSLVRGRVVIEEEDLEDPLWELEMALLESDVAMPVAEEILDGVESELVGETRVVTTSTSNMVEEALRDALLSVLDVDGLDFDEYVRETDGPVVVVFTGVNGVGKTTTIAKLSERLDGMGLSSVLANGDTFRAGANEQLEQHADALDRPLIAHEQGGDPAAVIYDAVEYAEANDVDVVLGDTAGRLHTSDGLMDQLGKIDRVVDPDLTIFVDESVAGQDAVERAREFDAAATIDGAILTKADADSQGGAAISIAQVTGKPISFLGTGQGYDDLERFDPEEMVDRLLGVEE